MLKLKPIVALGISLLALTMFFTRLNGLSSFPPSLFADEVDAQYQALTFNTFRSDYYGNPYPSHFHSFSDWRTPLFIYVTALLQSVFPQAAQISARLAAAVLGIAFGFVFFKLISLFFKSPPWLLAVSLVLSPYLIHYSRTGFEVTGMLLCLALGLYFFFKYTLSANNFHLLLSPVFLILSAYFYSTAKLFVAIIGLLLLIIWLKPIIRLPPKYLLLIILTSILVSSPLVFDTLSGRSGYRFSYINIFTEPQLSKTVDYLRYEDIFTSHLNQIGVSPPLSSVLFHNRPQLIFQKFINNYLSSYSLEFLILKGDLNLRHGFSAYGYFYLIDLLLILLGIFFAFFKQRPNRVSLFFLLLFLSAPLPFALTRDSLGPHATRLIILLIPMGYFLAYGASILSRQLLIGSALIYLLSFFPFWHYYTLHYPQISARSWHSNLKETVIAAKSVPAPAYYFSNSVEPFLPFFLYYWPYLPSNGTLPSHLSPSASPGFDGQSLDNLYYFGSINLSAFTPAPGSLIIVDSDSLKSFPDWNSRYIIVSEVKRRFISAPDYLLLSPRQN